MHAHGDKRCGDKSARGQCRIQLEYEVVQDCAGAAPRELHIGRDRELGQGAARAIDVASVRSLALNRVARVEGGAWPGWRVVHGQGGGWCMARACGTACMIREM
jgi:hypothetical protein